MATVILVRHGRTTANTDGVLAGRSSGVRLDDLGEQQATAAADRTADLPLAAVVSSPMVRCRQTAKALLAHQPSLSVHTEHGLAEVDYGEWTARRLEDLAKEPLWSVVQHHPAGAVFPGGESMAAMSARAVNAVRRWDSTVQTDHGDHAVWAAVSHGDVIKAVLADALGMHLDAFQRIVVDPASISVVRYTEGRPFVVMTNTHAGDLSHLWQPPRRGKKGRKQRRNGGREQDRGTSAADATVGGGAGPKAAASTRARRVQR